MSTGIHFHPRHGGTRYHPYGLQVQRISSDTVSVRIYESDEDKRGNSVTFFFDDVRAVRQFFRRGLELADDVE